MKKVVLSLLLVLLSLQFICGAEIELTKESYFPAETLQAEITGDFPYSIKEENIAVYKKDKVHPIPTDSGFLKVGDKYLYYAILPYTEGNYTLKIKDTKYYIEGELVEENIMKDFNITPTNDTYLQINPGHVSTKKAFEIDFKILNGDGTVEAEFEANQETEEIELEEGEEESFSFSIKNITEYTESKVIFSIAGEAGGFFGLGGGSTDYEIPVIIFPSETQEDEDENASLDQIDFTPYEIKATIIADTEYYFEINLENIGDNYIEGIEVSSTLGSDYIDITPIYLSLNPDEKESVDITLNLDEEVEEELLFTYENETLSIPITIQLTEDLDDVDILPDVIEEPTCAELGGRICDTEAEEICDGTHKSAKDGWCCIGTCKVEEQAGGGWIWGLFILLLLGIGGWYLYDQIKKGPKKRKEALEERTKKYQERFHPKPQKEVTKSLSKD